MTRVLQNEKYIGDALLQKRFTVDYLTHKMKVNEGEVPQYYVEKNHEPIISREVYALVQSELERRRGMPGRRNHVRMLSGRVRCAQCGSWLGKKIWRPNTSSQKVVWQCNGKYDKSHEQCTSGNLTKHVVEQMFVIVVNMLLKGSSGILETQRLVYDAVFDTTSLQRERNHLLAEMDITAELMNRISMRNEQMSSDQFVYDPEYEALQSQYEESENLKLKLDLKIQNKMAKKVIATEFFEKLKGRKKPVSKFDIDLWNGLLDHIEVHSPDDVRFLFRDGSEVKVDMSEEEKKRPALTDKQKVKISELRRDGVSYNKIASKMRLTQGQVRSFCLSRVPGRVTENPDNGEPEFCKTCGQKLVHTPGYRKKIFCSDGCLQDWWNRYEQIKTGKGRATNEIICQGCGKSFVAYGSKRKYCSRKCYVKTVKNRSYDDK